MHLIANKYTVPHLYAEGVAGPMAEDGVRLNKFIAEAGVASRRAADRLIEEGNVTINGRTAVLGDRVSDGDRVCVNGKPIKTSGFIASLLPCIENNRCIIDSV